MKKAFLVNYVVETRVVVDVPENIGEDELESYEGEDYKNEILNKAQIQILNFPFEYICEDNAEIKDDTECPYGTFFSEN